MSKIMIPSIPITSTPTSVSPNWQATLATRIKTARQELQLSQKELGQKLRLSDKAVSAYEVGRAVPTIETLIHLSQLVYKPIGYFFEQQSVDLELQIKLKQIEKELLEAKRSLIRRNSTK